MDKTTIYNLFSYLLSFILANSGIIALRTDPKLWPIGISLVVNGFLVLYFLNHVSTINENAQKIEELKKDNEKINQNIELNEKLLNTLKDIKLLENIKKK
ncbi:MAG: hypothetical protein WC438_01950 [Candidatus Pacearchaeota archaeon]